MAEYSGYNFLKRALRQHPGVMVQRVENGVGPGTPDVYTCVQGISAWFETKELTPLTIDGVVYWRLKKVTAAQPPWWARARACGVPLFGIFNFPSRIGHQPIIVRVEGLIAASSKPGLTVVDTLKYRVTLEEVYRGRHTQYLRAM